MKRSEIDAVFTAKVAEFVANGFTFLTKTMSGSQGEVAKVDMTNGKDVYRIWVQESCEIDEGYYDYIAVNVGKASDEVAADAIRNGWRTMWTDEMVIEWSVRYYQIDHRKTWYGTREEVDARNEVHDARRKARRVKKVDIVTDKMIDVVWNWVRKQRGMKTVARGDVSMSWGNQFGRRAAVVTARNKSFYIA